MRLLSEQLSLSASDLANHLGCRYLTALDKQVAHGELEPPRWKDPTLEVLQQRGFEHEEAYVESLRRSGLSVVRIDDGESPGFAFEQTCSAIRRGVHVIVQATLQAGRWFGRADVLRRIEKPSNLGRFSYEVYDTKLAKETRASTVLQLCLYSDLLSEVQGTLPERTHVVPTGVDFVPESFRVSEFLAYYRLVRKRLEEFVAQEPSSHESIYPEPVPQCDICRWWPSCDRKRHEDDHLSLVAGISKIQRRELESWDVGTLEGLANLPLPLSKRPQRGSVEGLVRVREQARVQFEGREKNAPIYELLPTEPERGLARLPEPSPGDMFFDVEGDTFVGRDGLEYLLGWATLDNDGELAYTGLWGLDREGERAAFQSFVDSVVERRTAFRGLHVYHFTPYDTAALKRLMGRYATREDEVDRLLRAGVFVDLHAVVRQSLRASVERYSIKELEPFYGYEREIELPDASANLRALERALELGSADLSKDTRSVVEAYNRDDCVSTLRLRDWLERLRTELIDNGETVERPELLVGDPSDALEERSGRVQVVMESLLRDVPIEEHSRSKEQHARWLLAYMLDWHRREGKAPWWEYFRLQDLTNEELLDEKAALADLTFVERIGGTAKCPVDRYSFPKQDAQLRKRDRLHTANGENVGTVDEVDLAHRTVDIKKAGQAAGIHPEAVFAHSVVRSGVLSDSVMRLAEWVVENGVVTQGLYRSARDLLLRRPPRLSSGIELMRPGEDTLDAAKRLGLSLDGGVLPVQGPPGSGKTYTGARMVCELVRAGKRVGITAVSHKVIRNLIDEVVKAADEADLALTCVQKVSGKAKNEGSAVLEFTDNGKVRDALENGTAQVGAGTAWLWAREEFFESVDVLFVDEAGQMSLANVLAVAQAAKSIVLLGDPRQLEQPQQGSHPDGTEVSALEHILGNRKTLPDYRGLFLAETWRLSPAICQLTSELFYEDRLRPRPGLELQVLNGSGTWDGHGLFFVPVEHVGNQSSSAEEVECVARIVESLVSGSVTWTNQRGEARPVSFEDILVVAPYNAQVADLSERLPQARIGTVDKFQGQEAPVVVYSLTTSSPEEAPRGMEFLYSLNRLNVATSRARCACILVASAKLFEPECRSPRQMQLANAFCRYVELAKAVELAPGTK